LEDWNNEPEKNDRVLVFVNLSAPRLSDAIIGDEIDVSLETMWSLSSGGDIIAGSNINLNGRALRSVASIASASGNWSIDESGVLRVKEVHAEKLCLGETCVTEGELRTIMQTAGLIAPADLPNPVGALAIKEILVFTASFIASISSFCESLICSWAKYNSCSYFIKLTFD